MQVEPVELSLIEDHLNDLRERISDAGHALDVYRAKTAAALGGGVFLLLLALGAGYDIVSNNEGIWFAFGVTREMLHRLAGGLGFASVCLFALAAWRNRMRDREGEARLSELEQEFARSLDRRDEIARLNE
ncbi:MAG TPA: hypothetical protein VE262_04265 [Blastocatellia bacterium]|nr:hypothetical protein [Blastocatellia bacterium]